MSRAGGEAVIVFNCHKWTTRQCCAYCNSIVYEYGGLVWGVHAEEADARILSLRQFSHKAVTDQKL